jgi:hypothetical protein
MEDNKQNIYYKTDRSNFSQEGNIYYNNDRQYQFVGSSINDNIYVKEFFSSRIVKYISEQITLLTKGVDEKGRDIVVPDDKILWVMNTVYFSYNPPIGFDQDRNNEIYIRSLVGQTITRIVYDITNVLGYEQCMNKYSIWNTVLGDFNENKLRSHAPIKLKEKRPNSFEFNMNY